MSPRLTRLTHRHSFTAHTHGAIAMPAARTTQRVTVSNRRHVKTQAHIHWRLSSKQMHDILYTLLFVFYTYTYSLPAFFLV